jgi:hypothetical protein
MAENLFFLENIKDTTPATSSEQALSKPSTAFRYFTLSIMYICKIFKV